MSTEKNDPDIANFFNTKLEINSFWKEIIREAIISNTDVRIEVNDQEYKYEPCGSAIEVGMIKFLMDNGEDI